MRRLLLTAITLLALACATGCSFIADRLAPRAAASPGVDHRAADTVAEYLEVLMRLNFPYESPVEARRYATEDRITMDWAYFRWGTYDGERVPPLVQSITLIDPPDTAEDSFSAYLCMLPTGDVDDIEGLDMATYGVQTYIATFRPDTLAAYGLRLVGLERQYGLTICE